MKIRLSILSALAVLFTVSASFSQPVPNYQKGVIWEKLDRGFVAIDQGKQSGVTLSWRSFERDKDDMAFDIYRSDNGLESVKLNTRPITGATYFMDKTGDASKERTYTLREAGSNNLLAVYKLTTKRASTPYISIPLVPLEGEEYKNFEPNDASVGDLDGDGELEIVVKRVGANYACTQEGICPGGNILEAYKMDGTRLWQINVGVNVRQGAQYFSFIVYDFDGDGRAEVAFKTSEGTTFADGKTIGDTDGDGITDYVIRERDPRGLRTFGKILTGPEFFSVIDGRTGVELARAPWIERGRSEDWGDNYGNRVDRQLMAVGFFDGKKPGIFIGRGYNGRSVMQAWNFSDNKLTLLWNVDTNNDPYKDYANQGNHNIRIGDVDGDGKDEVMYGACAIDHDGSPMYSTKLGHGDAMHLTDIDPANPGLEVWQGHEYPPNGSSLRDARTGKLLVHLKADTDVGRAMSADIDPRFPGCEIWSSASGGLLSSKGELISKRTPSVNMAVWWDGDLTRELLDGVRVEKWNGDGVDILFDGRGMGIVQNNGTKANPALAADILGDWREELIYRTPGNDELRIYITPYPTAYRIPTLLEDHIYRLNVAIQNVGYNQPTSTGFYLGPDKDPYMKARFDGMNSAKWKTALSDNGKGDWKKNWFLDGEKARVSGSPDGLVFEAGSTLASDADHAVLWTKKSFSGDIKVEYDFTRTDTLDRFVNIIYLLAEGSGAPGYDRDISKWNDKRRVPAMSAYFNNMNAIHVSYAAYENSADSRNSDYIRGRRYMPLAGKGLTGTELTPEYTSPMLFDTGVKYHLTILKRDNEVMMKVDRADNDTERYFYFNADDFPPVLSGRIGLRQMSGRKSLYSGISVFTAK